MNDFNHKRAWNKLAAPALMDLPQNIKQLVLQVIRDARGHQQNDDLSMPWPDGSDLYYKFEALPAEDLARAARIVWAAGHWHPGSNNWFRLLMRTGAYWKFSSYADQILRDKCGLDRNSRARNGFSFEIHEGFIRACVDFDRSWSWHEIGLATPDILDGLKVLVPNLNYSDSEKSLKLINEAIKSMKGYRPKVEDPMSKFFDLKEFYDE